MKIKNLGIVFLLSLFVWGCAGLNSEKNTKKFAIERSWARNTIQGEYLGARINHTMSPILSGDLVISGNEIDSITAFNQKTGRTIWTKRLNGGVTSSAKEDLGVLFFGAGDGFFYALSAETGQVKWSFPLRAEGIGTPLVVGDVVYFIAGNNSAYALKKSSGEQIWYYNRVDSANLSVRGASEPSVYGNQVIMGFSDGYLVALDRTKGSVVWEKQLSTAVRFRDVDSKPVIDGDKIYVSSYDGQLFCLRATDGQTIWTNDEGGFTAVTVQGDKLYYSTSTRKVMALEKASGKVIWTNEIKNQVAGQPIATRGLVIYGEWRGMILAVDALTGVVVTDFSTGRGVTSKIALTDDSQRMFVMTADANLFALKLRLKGRDEAWPWE